MYRLRYYLEVSKMNDSLTVYYEEHRVGSLRPDNNRRLCFVYSPEWFGYSECFPVSKSMPLETETYSERAHAFFTNLPVMIKLIVRADMLVVVTTHHYWHVRFSGRSQYCRRQFYMDRKGMNDVRIEINYQPRHCSLCLR